MLHCVNADMMEHRALRIHDILGKKLRHRLTPGSHTLWKNLQAIPVISASHTQLKAVASSTVAHMKSYEIGWSSLQRDDNVCRSRVASAQGSNGVDETCSVMDLSRAIMLALLGLLNQASNCV